MDKRLQHLQEELGKDALSQRQLEAVEDMLIAPRIQITHLHDLAKRLTLALADECAFAGEEAAEASLVVLQEATKMLGLQKEVSEIDTLSNYGLSRQ